jgi:predicted small metal-binding protein
VTGAIARKYAYWKGMRPSIQNEQVAMKAMTCRELGGTCDVRLVAASWEEMVKAITRHVVNQHPDVAKRMEQMHSEDPKRWGREMKPKWEAVPEI